MQQQIEKLYSKDTKVAYATLLELELECAKSDALYPYFDTFLEMLDDSNTYIRIRGFRLLCHLAAWDKEDKINRNIVKILSALDDEKGTAVRQCLAHINQILLYKDELHEEVECKLQQMDLSKYKDTLRPLIQKDIDTILKGI